MKRYTTEFSYDVMANEIPYFKTINYTEYATSFMMVPLSQILREQQVKDAYYDEESEDYNPPNDYLAFNSEVSPPISSFDQNQIDELKKKVYRGGKRK